jgi:hypothetical protein
VGEEIGQREGVILAEVAIVEDQQELTALALQALDRVRNARREIPEVPLADIVLEANPPAPPSATDAPARAPTAPGTKTRRRKGKPATPDAGGPPAKLSALAAAAKVLAETGRAMSCPDLIGAMAAKGSWTSPGGKTPAGTLCSAILRDLQTKGDAARFVKVARGQFAIRPPQGSD